MGVSQGSGRQGFYQSNDREIYVTETEREKNVVSRYEVSGVDATKWICLVDLSDTTNWKHESTTRIDISAIGIMVDRAANSVGAVNIGVVTRVDGTNGDVKFFSALGFSNTSETFIRFFENYAPSQVKLGVSGGVLTRLVSNGGVTNDTAIQTDVSLDSFRGSGTVAPAVGDIVVRFLYTSGTSYNSVVRVFYHAEDTP